MITIDTETCGLHGLAVTIQHAKGEDGPITIHEVWKEPIYETLELIHNICEADYVCGFNLAFDWFHLCKLYTTFMSFHDMNAIPEEHIEDLAILEEQARFKDVCVKPRSALDIMLWARKGKYQSLMEREDIRIRRVPTELAYKLADFLERAIQFDNIYFAKRKDKYAPKWKVYDVRKGNDIDPNFKDIKLKFAAASGLKHLARHALGVKVIFHKDIEVPHEYRPEEAGYAPFALALATKLPSGGISWNRTWPDVIKEHILHWRVHERARKYACDDVDYTRKLRPVVGNPEPGDNDSVLACMVGAARWHGYAIDLPKIAGLKRDAERQIKETPIAPKVTKIYLEEKMDEMERLVLVSGTRKAVLESISKWSNDDSSIHPAAVRAQEVLEARKAKKKIELYKKLLLAKRFHASFVVIGALSNRMSGSDKLNPQGIDHLKFVRSCFILADQNGIAYAFDGAKAQVSVPSFTLRDDGFPEWTDTNETMTVFTIPVTPEDLDGGDFKSFEVTIADAVFNDPKLRAALKSGKKIHALFATKLFPDKTYEQILASDGKNPDYYDTGKKGIFTMFYGGDENTLKNKHGIPVEIGQAAYQEFCREYTEITKERAKITEMFCSMRQPGGIGSKVEWHEPADYVESFLGFRRYFTLENKICKALFNLAQHPPEEFKHLKIKVMRRERIQTACGAAQSAIYAAAFGIQAANMRAANNHRIQSPGATITKALQKNIWDVQPPGITPWLVRPLNVHDEIMNPMKPEVREPVKQKVTETIDFFRKQIPLLAIDWFSKIPNWASKKGV